MLLVDQESGYNDLATQAREVWVAAKSHQQLHTTLTLLASLPINVLVPSLTQATLTANMQLLLEAESVPKQHKSIAQLLAMCLCPRVVCGPINILEYDIYTDVSKKANVCL